MNRNKEINISSVTFWNGIVYRVIAQKEEWYFMGRVADQGVRMLKNWKYLDRKEG